MSCCRAEQNLRSFDLRVCSWCKDLMVGADLVHGLGQVELSESQGSCALADGSSEHQVVITLAVKTADEVSHDAAQFPGDVCERRIDRVADELPCPWATECGSWSATRSRLRAVDRQ